MRLIAIVVYDGVQLLDVTGPASVFAEVAAFVTPAPYRVLLVGSGTGVVQAEGGIGLGIVAWSALDGARVDSLVVPGADKPALRRLIADPQMRSQVISAAACATRLASVCTGAFALASWGLLDGHRAATHWSAAAELARRFPAVQVDAQSLYVEDGRVWTSAGVSTGIDMALAMVERDHGREIATKIARRLVLQMRRPGHQSQFSSLLAAQGGEYAALVAWVSDHLEVELTNETLADRAGQSSRTFHRRFTADSGVTPAAFVEALRLQRARDLLEAGQSPKRVAVAVGLRSLDRLGRAFHRAYGLTPSTYRALHGS